ncbi:E3 ubiquitin-protein ligase RBBP6-like isoform X1 [Takifugu rubripes]|uniref:E3 ubiquitin-protein ligase RBBP6-like isoform X1 n=1 Tax=Takifugu rubripes TaxID=31033 RepID=UPI0011453654|nr:E3 ubiquitin-protein ligase RBBP6 isoform X1 [Takifugu rubripes]
MAHIHYKFASKRSPDTVIFDGPHITLQELKRLIMEREKLRSGDCDLQITNSQTKEEFTDGEGLIAKGSSVIVRRIPVVGARSSSNSKIRNIQRSDGHLQQPFGAFRAMGAQSSSSTLPLFSKMTNLAFVDASEEDKLKVLVNQSLYDSMSYNMKAGPGLPANYTCFRCGSTGHHIRNCPVSADKATEAPLRIKKSTGIPRSFMVEVDDPSIKGAMLTNCGHYAIPAIHAKAYAVGKKEKPPFLPQELPVSNDKDPVPKELLCLICKEMLTDAVVIPCCGNSFCDDCIRTALLDSDQHTCPTCKQSEVSPDTLIANKFLRQAVNTFQKDQGQPKVTAGNDGAYQSENPAWAPDPVLKKPPQSAHKQQQTPDPQPSAQECLAPPLTTGPTPPPTVTAASLQPLETQAKTCKNEPEEQTCDEAAAAQPPEERSATDATAAAVLDSTSEEKPPTVSVTPQQSSTDPVPGQVWPPTYWESTTSSTSCPPSSSSSTYPSVPPPLFPPPHYHSFFPAQHHLNSYPPGYPPATPIWSIQPPQGAPIPPLCSSTNDWYKHQREKNETRSPHRGSTHSSRSKPSKSSRSYSRSSSRSRSRSRSVSRSRATSPDPRSRHLHVRSRSSYTYSYGYKRSPTPSSSSSPRIAHHSRSKSPSDHRKKTHHSRHHGKKSSSGRSSSRRRGERGQEGRGSEENHGYDRRARANSSLEPDQQHYLQWKRDYKEWCDKYYNSYVSHFHQLPPPLLSLPPSPHPHWEGREGDVGADTRSRRHHSRSSAHADHRSPQSRSSSDCRSTASRSSSDGRSSPSHSSNHSRSPASHLSSDGCSTPSKRRAADYARDGRKDQKRSPRRCKEGTPGLEKASPCQPSEPVRPLVKTCKQSEYKRERRGHKNSEKETKQASKRSDRGHYGNSKTDSRSEKHGKRKGDDAKSLAETGSSKRLKAYTTEGPQACEGEAHHPSDKKRSGKEKTTQPVSEEDVWEEGMKVKPPKRISINISLDGRKKEEKHEMLCLESSTEKPREEVQKSGNGGEGKVNEMEVSQEQEGEAREEVTPDEREQSLIWMEDVSDHQDQVKEEGETKGGWHCTFRHEEENTELQEERDERTASVKEEETREGRSGGQGRRESLPGETASTETESWVEVKQSMETNAGTRRTSHQDRAETEDSDRHGSHGNGLERTWTGGALEQDTQDRASEGEDGLEQVPRFKWKKEEQDEESKPESCLPSVSKMEKSTISRSHCGTAPSSGRERSYSSSSRDWKRELENDGSMQKQREGKRSQERRKEGENHRDGGEERHKRNLRDGQGKFQDAQLHQCSGSLPVPAHTYKDKAAGNHQSTLPLLPHCWSEEKGPLSSKDMKNRREKDGERASSSTAVQESSSDYGRKERKMEKGEAPDELLEEWEEHKKSRKGRDGREY